jgi:hypothetical protein
MYASAPTPEIETMMMMGIPREHAEASLRRTSNSIEAAIELCFTQNMDVLASQDQETWIANERRRRAEERIQRLSSSSSSSSPGQRGQEGKSGNEKRNQEAIERERKAIEEQEMALHQRKMLLQNKFSHTPCSHCLYNHMLLSLGYEGRGFVSLGPHSSLVFSDAMDPDSLLSIQSAPSSDHESDNEKRILGTKEQEEEGGAASFTSSLKPVFLSFANQPGFVVGNGSESPDGTIERSSAQSPSFFILEIYNRGRKVALVTSQGKYVRVSEETGGLVADIAATTLRTRPDMLSLCLFDVYCRTTIDESDSLALPDRLTFEDVGRPLGMQSGAISDEQLLASSVSDSSSSAHWGFTRARFRENDQVPGGWLAGTNNTEQWLQIDLGKKTLVTGLGIQSPIMESYRILQFKVSVSMDGHTWATLQLAGTTLLVPGTWSQMMPRVIKFDDPLYVRFIRICPTKWNAGIALRAELYGPHFYEFKGTLPLNQLKKESHLIIPGDSFACKFIVSKPDQSSHDNKEEKDDEEKDKPQRHFKFVVTAKGLSRAHIAMWLQRTGGNIHGIRAKMRGWGRRADEELVTWINNRTSSFDQEKKVSADTMDPRDVTIPHRDRLQMNALGYFSTEMIRIRFALLKNMNKRLKRVLPYVDLSSSLSWTTGAKLMRLGYNIFYDIKSSLLEDSL